MALFKILKGKSANLPTNKVNGYCYVTTDEHKLYVDYTKDDGTLDRFALNAVSADQWKTARNLNGMVVNGTSNVVNYGTCSTAAATAAKIVSCSNFALITGAEITVKFTTTNTASSPTLNVNNTGAKAIYYRGSAISARYLAANRTYTFRYNGSQYDLVGDLDTNTTYGSMSIDEGAAGTATTNRVLTAANLKGIINSHAPTKTGTGASGTWGINISGNAATASKVNNKLTVGSKSYDGSADITIAASDLGLASAMLFLGTTTTAITDGAKTNPITIGGASKTVTAGNVVLYGSKEFVWTGSAWELLGDEGSYKVKQTAVADPSTSGTASAFIDSISQDANGKITVTKKTVAVTNSAPTLSWGTTSTVGTVAGTNLQVKMPANPNTDTKVTQTATTSDATYPLLLAPNGQTVTTTTSAYFNSGVTLNPSTNTIAANISGNAATATKLGTTTVGSSTKPIYLNNGSPTTCVDFLPLTAGENKKLTGPLGLTENVNYGSSLPDQGFKGQLFFLEEEEKPSLPPGGTYGDILVKISEADGDANWLNPWNEEALTGLSHRGHMTDADLDLKRGLYTFGPNTANTPATGYGCIQNIIANDIAEGVPIGGTTEGSWIWQIGFHTGYPNIFLRNSVNADPFGSWKKVWLEGDAITGAVWNDYAEYRESDCEEFGYVLMETGDDSLTKTTERLSHFAGVSSDTWGFSQGETTRARTPIAVAGRVLVYPYQDRNNYKPGDCVCAAPGGTVDIMTREEVREWPDRIVGTVSCVPNYEEWGGGECADRDPVKVNGRIWIKVK